MRIVLQVGFLAFVSVAAAKEALSQCTIDKLELCDPSEKGLIQELLTLSEQETLERLGLEKSYLQKISSGFDRDLSKLGSETNAMRLSPQDMAQEVAKRRQELITEQEKNEREFGQTMQELNRKQQEVARERATKSEEIGAAGGSPTEEQKESIKKANDNVQAIARQLSELVEQRAMGHQEFAKKHQELSREQMNAQTIHNDGSAEKNRQRYSQAADNNKQKNTQRKKIALIESMLRSDEKAKKALIDSLAKELGQDFTQGSAKKAPAQAPAQGLDPEDDPDLDLELLTWEEKQAMDSKKSPIHAEL